MNDILEALTLCVVVKHDSLCGKGGVLYLVTVE